MARELRPATLWPAPFLRNWTLPEVEAFRYGLLRYRADRGEARLTDLVDPDLLSMLELVHVGFADVSEEEQLGFLLKLKCETSEQVMEHLRVLHMSGTGIECYVRYATAFRKQWRRLELLGEVSGGSRQLLKYFREGLEPMRLRRRIELKMEGPAHASIPNKELEAKSGKIIVEEDEGKEISEEEDGFQGKSPTVEGGQWKLPQLMRVTLEAVREEESARALLGHKVSGVEHISVPRPSSMSAGRGERAGVRCRNCGRLGHLARDCYRPLQRGNLVPATTPRGGEAPQKRETGERGDREQRRCYVCGSVEHLANRCPERRDAKVRTPYVRETPAVTRSQDKTPQGVGQNVMAMATDVGQKDFEVDVKFGPAAEVCRALIDTGANNTFVSTELFKLLVRKGMEARESSMKVVAAGGQVMDSERYGEVEIDVAQVQGRVVVHELPDLGRDAVLGLDTLSQLGLDVDVRGRRLVIQEELTEVQDDLREQLWRDAGITSQDMDAILENATPELRPKLECLIRKYADLFGSLPRRGADLGVHVIPLEEGSQPVRQPVRRVSPKQREVVAAEIGKLLQLGVIRPSKSAWASPVVVVRKRSGDWRLCIDYRMLNKLTRKDVYPMPRMDDLMDALHGQRFFAALDMNSGYYQVRMEEDDITKTAFITSEGAYEFVRMPFGLASAPATFQRGMNTLLADLLWKSCLVYLDDIIVFGQDEGEFMQNVERVFTRLCDGTVRLNARKTRLGLRKVAYLGQVVSHEGRRVDPSRIQGIKDLRPPETVKQLKSFLGLLSYYRPYLESLSTVVGPLYELLKSKVKFRWQSEEQAAFESAKQMLIDAPVLKHPDFDRPFMLQTDASKQGVGGVLLQDDAPVMFLSRTFTATERKWDTIDQEAFAIVWCLCKLRSYLLDRPFVIRTDHRNLQFIQSCKSARVQRWRLIMSEFDYSLEHLPGRSNVVADALSRLCVVEEPKPQELDSLEGFGEVLREAQATATAEEVTQWEKDPKFRKADDGLWRRREGAEKEELLVVPLEAQALKARLCTLVHAHVLAGHFGVTRMYEALRGRVWWSRMKEELQEFVRQCPRCQRKAGKATTGEALSTMTSELMDTWHIDYVGPLPESDEHCVYILVMVERLSRYVELVPVKKADAVETTRAIMDNLICRHGIPKRLVSDGGSHFCNKVLEEVCDLLKIHHHVVIPYHPAANGAVERQNKVMMDVLRAKVEQVEQWDRIIPQVQFAMNCAPSRMTGVAPFYLVYGRTPWTPLTRYAQLTELKPPSGDVLSPQEWGRLLVWRMHHLWAEAHAQQTEYWNKWKAAQEEGSEFQEGQLVLVRSIRRPTKLAHRWRGPFRIKKKINSVVYVVENLITEEEEQVHVSRIRGFNAGDMNDLQIMSESLPRGEYLVERVLDHERRADGLWFSIKWLGWEEATIEPEANVGHTAIVRDYAREHSLALRG